MEMVYSEFIDWVEFLEYEKNYHSKLDWYLAQIASWICKVNAKEPEKIQVKDFLLEFQNAPPEPEKERTIDDSRSIWAGVLGISLPKK